MNYAAPSRMGRVRDHYLVAVDPGTRRPGVSVWYVPGAPASTPFAASTPLLVCARAPSVRVASPDAAAGAVVDVVEREVDTFDRTVFASGDASRRTSRACVVERPVKYATRRAAHDDVDGLLAMIAALPWIPRAKPTPATWKGNVPKDVTHARTLAALNRIADLHGTGPLGVGAAWTWAALAPRVDDDPNARDALALGAWALGIVGRGATGGR